MSDDLSIQGTLAETTVPDLFRTMIRSAETGIVTLADTGRTDAIYFVDGRITYATSSDPDLGLAEILLRQGDLTLQQYSDALDSVVSSRRVGSVLCDLGYLKPDELTGSIEEQARRILLQVLGYRTGTYNMEFTEHFPPEIIALPLSTERLMMEGVKRIECWSLIERGVGRPDRLLQQLSNSDARVYALDFDEEESYVYSLLSEPQTLTQLCARSYLSDFLTCRTLWSLLATNLIEDAAEGTMDEKRAEAASEYELEGIVEQYNSAFQEIFGLVFQKIGDHTYDFIDRVLLHVSADVMPYLSGMSMVNEGRVDFDQILTNAIASGSGDRAAIFHNVLNELLYGWIFEIRSEFGGETEAQVIKMVEKLRK